MKTLLTLAMLVFLSPLSWADEPASAKSAKISASPVQEAPHGATKLNFENEVVEGMNKQSLDSANNVIQQDGSDQHLFHKRKDFKKETPVLIHEIGESE